MTYGRKQLAANPLREIGDRPVPLQDWPVPIVYEAGPIACSRRPRRAHRLHRCA